MIASIEHKFALLANPKTGTTALEAAFGRYAEIEVRGAPKWKHINYVMMRRIFGGFLERRGCQVYTVVRHPIDVLVSWYRYRAREELRDPKHPRAGNYTGNISFAQFVAEWAGKQPPPRARIGTSVEFCLLENGALAPVTYYRYDDLQALYARLADHVGARPPMPRKNVSPKIAVDIDREALSALPKMRAALEIYARIPFAAAA